MAGSLIIRLAACALLWTALAVQGGPYAHERDGVDGTGTVGRAWISAVVAFEPSPVPGSGGSARDDLAQTASVAAVVGPPADFTLNGVTRHYLSLGAGGRITVTFDLPLRDGPGPDFAVFENGFHDQQPVEGTSREGLTNQYLFAELAVVEVGSTTQAWARFPVATVNTERLFQATYTEEDRFASQDVTGLDGFAGKHLISFGTPFDLARLTNHPAVQGGAVDLSDIRFVRLTDVPGDGSVLDDQGRPVHDPYFDAYAVGLQPAPAHALDGFDLRGIVALHQRELAMEAGRAVSFPGVSGLVYQLEYAPALDATNWTPLAVQTSRGERVVWSNTPPESGVLRVRRWAAP